MALRSGRSLSHTTWAPPFKWVHEGILLRSGTEVRGAARSLPFDQRGSGGMQPWWCQSPRFWCSVLIVFGESCDVYPWPGVSLVCGGWGGGGGLRRCKSHFMVWAPPWLGIFMLLALFGCPWESVNYPVFFNKFSFYWNELGWAVLFIPRALTGTPTLERKGNSKYKCHFADTC